MDQKPPVVPRVRGGPWGDVEGEKRVLSAEYDLSSSSAGDGGANRGRGVSEPPPLKTCRSANASPLPLHHQSPLRSNSLNCSLEELSARREDLEKKRKMVQNERLREQETQRREQVRLEEILSMCAEYERQVQWERDQGKGGVDNSGSTAAGERRPSVGSSTPWQQRVAMASSTAARHNNSREVDEGEDSSPSDSPSPGSTSSHSCSSSSPLPHQAAAPAASNTPPATVSGQSVIQNRIKTNGSLPRDKQRSLPSPPADVNLAPRANNGAATATSPTSKSSSTPSPDTEFPYGFNFDHATHPLHQMHPHATSSLPRHFGQHPRGGDVIIASATSPPTSPTFPQSPRTRIRTNAASKVPTSPSSPLPSARRVGRADVADEGDESSMGVDPSGDGHQRQLSRTTLLLLASPQGGRPFGGTLPRSSVPCAAGESARVGGGVVRSTATTTTTANGVCGGAGKGKGATPEGFSSEVVVEVEELKRERGKLLVALAAIRRKMNDIERQQEEALRELEMEQALLEGELNAVTGKVAEEEGRVNELEREVAAHEHKASQERERTLRELSDCQRRVEEAQLASQRIENEMLSIKDPEKVESLREKLKHQLEVLEAERKVFEDLEFQQLEREAWWESGREDLSREVAEVSARAAGRRQRMEQLEGEREEAQGAAEAEASRIRGQRELLLGRLNQGRQRLKTVERRLSELSRMGVSIASWDGSPEGSSDPDESPPLSSAENASSSAAVHNILGTRNRVPTLALSTGNLDVLNGSQSNVQRKQSQDDLDRISRVTSGAPIDVSRGGSLGRRTIESLRTIERNRQIHLVQQGSQVIEEERRRVEELKRRAQNEVRAKWEEGRLRGHSTKSAEVPHVPSSDVRGVPCNGGSTTPGGDIRVVNSESLNSIGSEGEESSITESSDAPAESTTSSEDAVVKARRARRQVPPGANQPTDTPKMSANSAVGSESAVGKMGVPSEMGGPGNDARQLTTQEQPSEKGLHGESSHMDMVRPISDVSSEGEEGQRGVRRRAASTGRLTSVQHQRPLTRYLPIRGQQLDLRAHMEWAGHQPDLCPHIHLSATVCRGYLLKAPASVSASVVRRASSASASFGSGSRGSTLLSGLRGGGWARRWFAFDRSARCFAYYTDSSEKKSRCVVDFEAIQDVYVDHLNSVKSPSPRLTFCVKTRERAFHLVAPSAEAMRIWVDVIFTGAEGYTGFEYVT
ncbi:pleckstrin homology-like domain family B member 1 isoform X2 [Ischnura elegans]|uniref:pleckstrin homology-like domain family B member 1 isoform X2 n=1 Tax=Ischnura elegans TaxID=197161 RepID=UPI001ED87D14|nr:pleckstrin homology-like domain family B member 1 isoform X2 [Ischnura elegans]